MTFDQKRVIFINIYPATFDIKLWSMDFNNMDTETKKV